MLECHVKHVKSCGARGEGVYKSRAHPVCWPHHASHFFKFQKGQSIGDALSLCFPRKGFKSNPCFWALLPSPKTWNHERWKNVSSFAEDDEKHANAAPSQSLHWQRHVFSSPQTIKLFPRVGLRKINVSAARFKRTSPFIHDFRCVGLVRAPRTGNQAYIKTYCVSRIFSFHYSSCFLSLIKFWRISQYVLRTLPQELHAPAPFPVLLN